MGDFPLTIHLNKESDLIRDVLSSWNAITGMISYGW